MGIVSSIGNGLELIQLGKQDIVFAGGAEEVHWGASAIFDGMGALSSAYNDTPKTASRPYDANRDRFVISGGAGILVLEELGHARSRGARIYAEVVGYGAKVPPISSTKSLTGHALGAAGVNEAIYSLLMMQHDFICASANIEQLDAAADGMDIVRERRDGARLDTVMSNSFDIGGANATLVFARMD
jgi:3-oxoacyl-[acyl-carrier-protein] synthase-1